MKETTLFLLSARPRDNLPPSQLRIEGSRDPFLERLHRLDIIMAIDEKSFELDLIGPLITTGLPFLTGRILRFQSGDVHLFFHNLSTIFDSQLLG